MNTLVALFLIVFFAGCRSTGDIKQDIKNIVTDPGSVSHQEKLDDLERQYLRGKLTYAEFQEAKKKEEEHYNKEVQEREKIIKGDDATAPMPTTP